MGRALKRLEQLDEKPDQRTGRHEGQERDDPPHPRWFAQLARELAWLRCRRDLAPPACLERLGPTRALAAWHALGPRRHLRLGVEALIQVVFEATLRLAIDG